MGIGFSAGIPRGAAIAVIGALFCLAGCESRPSCESVDATATVVASATGSKTVQADQVRERWQQGVHAQTYTAGENSSCARCHAPLEWVPVLSERSQAWLELGLAGVGEPFHIPEAAWSNVSCEICHAQRMDEIDGEISWLAIPPLGLYEDVSSPRQLCSKCHVSEVEDGHTPLVYGGVHEDLGCSDCHDAHDGSASCGSRCHQPFAMECTQIETHDKPHSDVTCSGCHDGMDFAIGWNEERARWDTFTGGDPRVNREARPFTSHYIVLEVDCERCHAPGDHPWDPVP